MLGGRAGPLDCIVGADCTDAMAIYRAVANPGFRQPRVKVISEECVGASKSDQLSVRRPSIGRGRGSLATEDGDGGGSSW